ncbi:hypothetical protein EJ06DRAFT_264303 [Trichodelitschia bisporula]|uniref:Inositolphosphotransferase Aur1/Ipt1 domain-containing protein n=1 Tax=Trichodelitschia bisporula TaxID=703511 RepID=A0A6G1HIT6_9PEZI|nr:hypothetical protein EJ06DRAFT_264303 [Trichodelitschia bisporula]
MSSSSPNLTVPIHQPEWNSKPAWKLPGWAEPIMVASILFAAMYFTRRRNYSILPRRAPYTSFLDAPDSARSSDDLLPYEAVSDSDEDAAFTASTKCPPKRRRWCGFTVYTPNTSRFRHHLHSRLLQKFPFLVEMLYWIINYAFYRMTSISAQALFAKTGIWNVAQRHGLWILQFEEYGPLSWLFPLKERDVQRWFMAGHQDALTFLNRTYALIHIPGTVGFIAWYYYAAPSHRTFAIARRTMTLTNFLAFATFVCYPTMPPRLLPAEYGFLDSVRHDDAQSVWMSGRFVNALAAMPSMHFGYAFCIGCTLLWHSTLLRARWGGLERGEREKSLLGKIGYVALGFGYPALILTTIVATANHYFLDAAVATLYVFFAFAANRVFFVFIPLEDWFLWCIRAEKPVPSTGERMRGGEREG